MEYCYSKLPNDILERIFCKLPITTLLQCRCVCKSWRDILCNPDFGKLQLEPGSQLILFMENKKIYWGEFQERSQYYHEATKVPYEFNLVNSCNGLLLIYEYKKTSQQVLHILNPVTGEYFSLPPYEQNLYHEKGLGFGFSNKTKQFNVIRLYFQKNSYGIDAEVFTIGTDNWRSIGKVLSYHCKDLHYNWSPVGTFVNGSFHWVHCYSGEICVFDSEEEKFRALSKPPWDGSNRRKEIGVYENTIYSYGIGLDCHNCELWLMKEYGVENSWIKILSIGHKKINIEKLWYLKKLMMLANGDFLLFFWEEVYLYNPREESFRSLRKTKFTNHHQILNKPCFGSLKDIMAVEGLKILNFKSGVLS